MRLCSENRDIWFQSKWNKAYTGFQQQALKPGSPTEAIHLCANPGSGYIIYQKYVTDFIKKNYLKANIIIIPES